jgi:hypothetical protein
VFPIFKVEEYRARVPPAWREQGGVFLPLYQREALWLGFRAAAWKPSAVKVGVGRVNAISGEPYDDRLHAEPQDYLVCPPQPWLDGGHAGRGTIRQFVAMPLGHGYTLEASVTGAERCGGLQITVFEPKPGRFPDAPPPQAAAGPVRMRARRRQGELAPQTMGLGAGGTMRQKIYPDPHGLEVWDQDNSGAVIVHLVNSLHFKELTGVEPPPTPIEADVYTKHGFPWFDLYDEAHGDVPPSERLTMVRTVAEREAELTGKPLQAPSVEVPDTQIKKVSNTGKATDGPSSSS